MRAFFDKSRILVTGGTGHLGSALIHHLVQDLAVDPAAIRVFYLSGSTTRSLRDIPGLDYAPGNILNPDDVERDLDDVRPLGRGPARGSIMSFMRPPRRRLIRGSRDSNG